MPVKHRLIGAGLATLAATGLHRVLAPLTRGRGAILMFHHVRPPRPEPFAPNAGLEITPAHLDAVLASVRRQGIPIVPLDAVLPILADPGGERFVALTFDDGYCDTVGHALPVLERHAAPFTVFATTGFADRTARLWWIELEDAIRRRTELTTTLDGRPARLHARTPTEKAASFRRLATHLMARPPGAVAAVLRDLGCDPAAGRALVDALCLDWDGLARLAAHPLATVGCHTLTHPCLAALDATTLEAELRDARSVLEERIGRPVAHLAYPYGGAGAAGAREFAAAAARGFRTGVTTRPGVLFADHAQRPTALPRLSVNGLWQSAAAFEVLLSGLPFALWSLGGRS